MHKALRGRTSESRRVEEPHPWKSMSVQCPRLLLIYIFNLAQRNLLGNTNKTNPPHVFRVNWVLLDKITAQQIKCLPSNKSLSCRGQDPTYAGPQKHCLRDCKVIEMSSFSKHLFSLRVSWYLEENEPGSQSLSDVHSLRGAWLNFLCYNDKSQLVVIVGSQVDVCSSHLWA